jgi:hypothetical protein
MIQERNVLRSIVAIVVGFLSVVVLSLGTDQLLHVLKVYPPWGDPMPQPALNALALSYRIVFTIFGSYLAARLAPRDDSRFHRTVLRNPWRRCNDTDASRPRLVPDRDCRYRAPVRMDRRRAVFEGCTPRLSLDCVRA